jgi:hypothetical protein
MSDERIKGRSGNVGRTVNREILNMRSVNERRLQVFSFPGPLLSE